MRSYVVKRRLQRSHSRRRRMESASLLSRESTTRSCPKPQYGHFMLCGFYGIKSDAGLRVARRKPAPPPNQMLMKSTGQRLEEVSPLLIWESPMLDTKHCCHPLHLFAAPVPSGTVLT